jgi:hypothetical protein
MLSIPNQLFPISIMFELLNFYLDEDTPKFRIDNAPRIVTQFLFENYPTCATY